MIKLKIDTTKFLGAKLFSAKDGTRHVAIPLDANNIYEGAKGAYLNLVVSERQEVSQYGQTHSVKLDLGKDRKDEKVYVGDGTEMIFDNAKPKAQSAPAPAPSSAADDDMDDCPF